MVEQAKKVNFYRLALSGGRKYRMKLSEDYRLEGSGGGVFAYLAPVFDSEDMGGTWHRLCLEGYFENCKYEILAAATDADLRDDLEKEDMSPAGAASVLKQYTWTRRVNTDDMLLHELKGRYLWVLIQVSGARQDSRFRMEGFRVEFPCGSFTEYLPEIYRQDRGAFFERYMAVFQSLYEDLEKEVEKLPSYLDYETAPDDYLPLFAGWTGDWSGRYGYTPEQMRYLFQYLQEIQSGRGTKAVMEQMLSLVTGRRPMIVEYFKWHDWMKQGSDLLEDYERLFGRSEDTFTVILDASGQDISVSREWLVQFLEDYTPLGMHGNVVLLRKSSHMDTHCYLDRNSCLSTPVTPDTGGFVLGGNYILG